MNLNKQIETANKFNKEHATGCKVKIDFGLVKSLITRTTTPAYIDAGSAVVKVEGRAGVFCVDDLTVLEDNPVYLPSTNKKFKYVRRPAAQLFVVGGE